MEFALYVGGLIAAAVVGYLLKQPAKHQTTPADVLSAYLEQELKLLVEKLQTVAPHDMEIKEEIINLLKQKIEQARHLHNKLLQGTFESVHATALSQVPFLTWDTYNETY